MSEKFEGDFKGFIEKQIEKVQELSNYDLVNQYGNFCMFLPYTHGEENAKDNALIMKAAQSYMDEILHRMEATDNA